MSHHTHNVYHSNKHVIFKSKS